MPRSLTRPFSQRPASARTAWFLQRILLTFAAWLSLREINLPSPEVPEGALGVFWNSAFQDSLYPPLLIGLLAAFATGWWPGVTAGALAIFVAARFAAEIPTPATPPLLAAFALQACVALARSAAAFPRTPLWVRSQRQAYAAHLCTSTTLGVLLGLLAYIAIPIGTITPVALAGSAAIAGFIGAFVPLPDPKLPELHFPRPLTQATARIWRFLTAVPLKLTFALVITAAAVGEQFPLSPFPMYSTWSTDTYLIYFKDKDDNPIPIQKLTFFKAGRYKGMFDGELKRIKAENRKTGRKPDLIADFGPNEYRRAGAHILRWIDKNIQNPGLVELLKPLRPLKVVRREIVLVDGKLTHSDAVVATDADKATPAP